MRITCSSKLNQKVKTEGSKKVVADLVKFYQARDILEVFLASKFETMKKRHPGHVFTTSEHAPDTLDGLKADWDNGKLVVWSGGSAKSIWSDPHANYVYRWVHDYDHLVCDAPTTPEGERYLYSRVQLHYKTELSLKLKSALAFSIWHIEFVGQLNHYTQFGLFPDDQLSFMLESLKTKGLI